MHRLNVFSQKKPSQSYENQIGMKQLYSHQAVSGELFQPTNPYIQRGHVLCAAKEIPLKGEDEKYFGDGLARIIELLEGEGLLTGGDSKSAVDSNHNHSKTSGKFPSYLLST
jgi:ATP-dependent helicase YprA (DUF1998 family)